MSKNPRHSITMIVDAAILLTRRLPSYGFRIDREIRFVFNIRRAAVNEILRLEAESELAAERAMPELKNRFDEIDKS